MRQKRNQRGSAVVEFTIAGIASMTLLISTFQLGVAMWNYHTLTYAIHEVSRYVGVRGVGCTKPGNTCSVSVATIAQKIATQAIGVPADTVNVTLTTDSGASTTCSPLNSCYANGSVWPPSSNSDNKVGKMIKFSASYRSPSVLFFFWPTAGTKQNDTIYLAASSQQSIIF